MSRLLHISDTHFGTEQPQVVEALLALAALQRPDRVVLSGDITQRACRAQFRAAAGFVRRLERPLLALPGNHDVPLLNLPARLFRPYAGYRRCFGRELEPEHETDDLLVIGVNTTRRYRHKDGAVSARQIERVCRRLARAARAQLRIVVTHQPLLVTQPRDEHNLLHGHSEALRAWTEAGVDLMLGGHIHLPYVRPASERCPGLSRRAWVVQAGTAVSRRVRQEAPNSVNLILHDSAAPERCEVQRWDFDAASGAFVQREAHRLQLSR